MSWRVDYDNDTGPDDDYFHEWWVVTNGNTEFICDDKKNANELCDLLNKVSPEVNE